MADQKNSLLPSDTTMTADDSLSFVDYAGPTLKKITLSNFMNVLRSLLTSFSSANLSNPVKFSSNKDTSFQNLPRQTVTKIRFEVEEFDTGGNFDSSTNHRFTAPVAGYYKFDSRVGWAQATADICAIYLYKNGARFKTGSSFVAPSSNAVGMTVSPPPMYLVAGDYIEIWCLQTSGTTDPTVFGNPGDTYFGGFLISSN